MKAIDRTDCGGKNYRQDKFRGSKLSTGQISGVKAVDRTDSGGQSNRQDRLRRSKLSTGQIPGVKDINRTESGGQRHVPFQLATRLLLFENTKRCVGLELSMLSV